MMVSCSASANRLTVGSLRLDPEARALLLPCGDTVVGNSAFHTKGIPPFAVCMNRTIRAMMLLFSCCTSERQRSHSYGLSKVEGAALSGMSLDQAG